MFPQISSAVQIRVSISGHEPVLESENVTVTPLQSSVAVATPVLVVSVEAEQSIVISAGHVMLGGVLSTMVIT